MDRSGQAVKGYEPDHGSALFSDDSWSETMRGNSHIIIGAGPAGLTAAYELSRRGGTPLLVEQSLHPGGISRTIDFKGYLFDIGGHRFLTRNERVSHLWHQLMDRDFLLINRRSRIRYRDLYFSYPLNLTDVFLNLGLPESLGILGSYLKTRGNRRDGEEHFEQWVTNRFGRRLFEMFFKTYTEKIWGMPCSQIQADWASQRIKDLNLGQVVANALFGEGKSDTLYDTFYYPPRGAGMMWERFAKEIVLNGGRIDFESPVTRIHHRENRISSVQIERDQQVSELEPDYLISTMPLNRLVRMLDPPPPPEVSAAAGKLSYRDFILVFLIVDDPSLFPDHWIYIHTPDVQVGRIQNFKNWSRHMVKDEGKTGLGMEYFCSVGDEIWQKPDSELISLAAAELECLGLAPAAKVSDGCVVRQEKAYPVYDSDYKQQVGLIREYLESFSNLSTIGRNGTHRYNNMDHSVLSGILAAENMTGASHDLWNVVEENHYLESGLKIGTDLPLAKPLAEITFSRIHSLAFGIATGTTGAVVLLLATIWLLLKGGDVVGPNLGLLSNYFFAYSMSLKGAIAGGLQAFAWGFLFGWLGAFIRNLSIAYLKFRTIKRMEMMKLSEFLDHLKF